MIDIHLLEQFHAFAEYGTLSEAAEKLHTSQPALTRSMKKLEGELGVDLFIRSKNQLRLNETGLHAARYAEDVLKADSAFESKVKSYDTGTKSFKAKYLGNTHYNSSSDSNTVNIQVEEPTSLTMSNYVVKSGSTGTVQAILTSSSGARLTGKTVTIEIGGVTYNMTSVGNGVYQKTINMTGTRHGTMKATFNGETGVYGSSTSKTCSLIIYQNRVGYGNLWILYPDSFSKGSSLNFYIVDSGQNPLSGYPVSLKYTRVDSGNYPWSDVYSPNSTYYGLINGPTVSYDWNNATLSFNVTFDSSTGTISMGEGGSLSNLPSGNSVTFNVTYNPT